MADIVYQEESYRIMGACFNVYNQMGSGFLEAVYQECLEIEFALANIPFASKPALRLQYRGQKLRQEYFPDFTCFNKIIVEIKAVRSLNDPFRAQTFHYLKSSEFKLGILVNFGSHPKLEYERIVN